MNKNFLKKGFLAGTFDNFHIGHQFLIAQALNSVDFLTIVVARDETVLKVKGFSPQNKEEERVSRLEKENYPQTKIRLGRSDQDFFQTLREESPDILFLGYDQKINLLDFKDFSFKVICLKPYFPQYFKSSHF